jgi:hypothetical protein
MPITKIAIAVDRNKTQVYAAVNPKWKELKRGQPPILTKQDVTNIIRQLRFLIKQAKGLKEITLRLLKRKTRCKASERTMREALKKRGIKFRRLRSKCVLTEEDKKKRFAWSKRNRHKPMSWWRKVIDMHQDMKLFPVYANAAARDHAARREIRGQYRQLGEGLGDEYVIQAKHLRYNTGAKPVRIAAGVGKGKVMMWHEVKGTWNGAAARDFYAGPVKQALKKSCPRKRSFSVLEDNDPTGYKSNLAKKAKKDNKIKVFAIPERSPDLNVCDFALWKEVTRVMRRQEKKFPRSKRETRKQYIDRLRRAAKSLSPDFINKSIGNLKIRCQRIYEAHGGHIEEGGRHAKK